MTVSQSTPSRSQLSKSLLAIIIVQLGILAYFTLADRTPPTPVLGLVLVCIAAMGAIIGVLGRTEHTSGWEGRWPWRLR